MSSDGGPRLWPITIATSALLWLFATAGCQHVLVQGALGEAYDSQAEHFWRGDVNVDADAIRWEAMIVDGKTRMYFGPFPAFLRMAFNLVYPPGRGRWSVISVSCAATIALSAFAGMTAAALRASNLRSGARKLVGNASVIGFGFASPLLLLVGTPSIYNEAIIWGFACSLAALYFAWQFTTRDDQAGTAARTAMLFGFSLCAAAALLARVTFGVPLGLVALLLAFRVGRERRLARYAALFVPLAAGAAFYLALSYARFGGFTGIAFEHYVNSVHRDFVQAHGMFSLRRVPFAFADYFSLRFPPVRSSPPFFHAGLHSLGNTWLSSLSFSETYISLIWSSGWLLFGAVFGIGCLLRQNCADWFYRAVAAALFVEAAAILSYFLLAQRYTTDLFPFLIFCLLVWLRFGGSSLMRTRHVFAALVVASAVLNSLTTLSWLVDTDQNIPPETRLVWKRAIEQVSHAPKIDKAR